MKSSVGCCSCGNPGCRWCDPNSWLQDRRAQVGKIDIREDRAREDWDFLHREPSLGVPLNIASLRDQMAMAALTGLIMCKLTTNGDDLSDMAYNFADSMMRAREKK